MHNGVVNNPDELKTGHNALGIKYISQDKDRPLIFNDSEALLYDVALYLENQQTQLLAKGSVAFVVIENDEQGQPIKVHFARNDGSPLKLQFKKGYLRLASEGKGVDIKTNRLYSYDYATGQLDKRYIQMPETWKFIKGFTYSPTTWPQNEYNSHESYYGHSAHEVYSANQEQTLLLPEETRQVAEDWEITTQEVQEYAYDFLNDVNSFDDALRLATNEQDSVEGKLRRIRGRLRGRLLDKTNSRISLPRITALTIELGELNKQADLIAQVVDYLQEQLLEEVYYNQNKQNAQK